MNDYGPHNMEDQTYSHVFDLLKEVIQKTHERSKSDRVSLALLFFLVRESNTCQSIWTLRKHSLDQNIIMVDAGMLLRAMLDAYLQAEYMLSEPGKAVERASDYLDFEHVDRCKQAERMFRHKNTLTTSLKLSSVTVHTPGSNEGTD